MNVLIYSLQLDVIKKYVLELQGFVKKNYKDIVIETAQYQDTFIETVSSKFHDIVYYDISGRESKENVIHELQVFRQLNPECKLLLMAETEEFAITGYKVASYDYIVFSEEKDVLVSSFIELMREKYDCNNVVYSVRIKGIWRKLELKDIVYMETNDHHVLFHMNNGQTYKKLANFNNLTPPIEGIQGVFQCHKSYVVNSRYIKDMVQNSFLMKDGRKISISKPNRKNARIFYTWCILNGYVESIVEEGNKKRP